MSRRFQFAFVGFSAGLVALLLFGAVGRSASPDTPYTNLGVYSEVLSRIKADYVEEPDMKAVTVGAITGMLESIDPYASYLNADQYKQYQKGRDGKKVDIGLLLSKRYGYMAVEDAIPGSPAAKAGFATGDVVESINNISTRDMPLAFAEQLLQGDPGTMVEFSVIRVRRSEPSKMSVARAAFSYPQVTGRLQGQVGIISVQGLQPGRVKDVASQVASLEKQGAKKLILDLRHSSSGNPEEGVALANLFMDSGLITYTQGQKMARQDYQATASKAVTKMPLAVIVNRSTAGPAEVAAAALLNSKRAQVVGERTFGDAAIRKTLTLNDGSAVILSVAKYYSPEGKAIQDTGVTPNVPQAEADLTADVPADDNLPDITPDDSKKPATDELLNKALQIL
ncbi:MAG: S41 family peptidase [Bryobacteraceae bacterium]